MPPLSMPLRAHDPDATQALIAHAQGPRRFDRGTWGVAWPTSIPPQGTDESFWATLERLLTAGADPNALIPMAPHPQPSAAELTRLPLPVALMGTNVILEPEHVHMLLNAGLDPAVLPEVVPLAFQKGIKAYPLLAAIAATGAAPHDLQPGHPLRKKQMAHALEHLMVHASHRDALPVLTWILAEPDAKSWAAVVQSKVASANHTAWMWVDDNATVTRSQAEAHVYTDPQQAAEHLVAVIQTLSGIFELPPLAERQHFGTYEGSLVNWALDNQLQPLARAWLALGVPPNRLHPDDAHPVFQAAVDNQAEALAALLDYGADTTVRDSDGLSLDDVFAAVSSPEAQAVWTAHQLTQSLDGAFTQVARKPRL